MTEEKEIFEDHDPESEGGDKSLPKGKGKQQKKGKSTELGVTEYRVQLDIDDSVAQGVYSNLAVSHFNAEEFVLDFVYLQPHSPKGRIRSRVIMTPKNIKRLVQMLAQNLDAYEKSFGPIGQERQFPGIEFSIN